MSTTLTACEKGVLRHLVLAWNEFLTIPETSQDETSEFRHGIHALQNAILARASLRDGHDIWETPGEVRP